VPLTILASDLLANDSDVEGDGLTLTLGSAVNGAVVLNESGNPVFTPLLNFNGSGSFEYTISDGHGGTDTATVAVTINPVNDAPVAVNNSYTTGMNKELSIGSQGGLMNISNLDAEQLFALGSNLYADFGAYLGLWKYDDKARTWSQLTSMDAEGMTSVGTTLYVDFGTNGIYRYTGSGEPASVDSRNPQQLFGLGSYLYADFGLRIGLQRYDGRWTSITTMDAQGMTGVGTTDLYVDFGTSGIYRYASGTGAFAAISEVDPQQLYGWGSFLYADFGTAGLSRYGAKGWANITTMDPQGMAGVGTALYVDFGTSGIHRYVSNELVKVDVRNPQQLYGLGSYLYGDFGASGLQRYGLKGWDVLSNMDVQGMSGAGTTFYADAGLNGVYRYADGILVNDTDIEGDLLSAILMSGPSNGTLDLLSNGTFSYTPNAGFTGTDTFTYRASDGAAQSNTATVTITVNAPMGLMYLTASSAPTDAVAPAPSLTNDELGWIVDEALGRWKDALGPDSLKLTFLNGVTFRIADLPGLILGQASQNTICIDVDAAGYGWFIDQTPADDNEYNVNSGEGEGKATDLSPASGRMDLLTAVTHEMGHVLGFADLDPAAKNVMSGSLDAGERRNGDGRVHRDPVKSTSVKSQEDLFLMPLEQSRNAWLTGFLTNAWDDLSEKENDKIRITID